jgi:RimJ/RimL family protein N-acetyltransferase
MRIDLPSTGCVIRPWSIEDAASLQSHANNRKIWLCLRDLFPHPYELSHAEGFLQRLTQENPQTTFSIAKGSEAIGCIGLHLGADVHRRTSEFGYWLGENYWGQGIMSEAVPAFVKAAFENFDFLERIYSEVFDNNPASIRILEKSGFVCEGRLRSNIFKDGVILDSLLYARLRRIP